MQLTFLHEFGPCNAFFDLILIRQIPLTGKCLVQASSKIVISGGVVSAKE